MAGFDMSKLKGNDLFIAAGGLAVFVSAFLPWFGYDFHSVVGDAHISGWNSGGLAILAILLSLAAAAFVVARAMGFLDNVELPIGPAVAVLGAAALAALFVLLRFLFTPGVLSFHYGRRIGLFLALAGVIVQVVFAFLSFQSSGEKLPQMPSGSAAPPPPPPPSAPPAPPAPETPTS